MAVAEPDYLLDVDHIASINGEVVRENLIQHHQQHGVDDQQQQHHPTDLPDDDLLNSIDPNYNEEEEERKYFRRKRLGVIKNVISASVGAMLTYSVYLGLIQMQFILHYDSTYRDVKYSNVGLQDIDEKILMGINITPLVGLCYTPMLIRFFGTKWVMFLATGIYALFVSTNYWERKYTLVPAAVAIGSVIVPLWASLGNYITRMAQKYHEYTNYKEQQEEEDRQVKGVCHRYIIIFQAIFYSCFMLSFVWAQMPFEFFIKQHLNNYNHTLYNVKVCGTRERGTIDGFNNTVLERLPKSMHLIIVESVLMAVAFLAMMMMLLLCGAAYRPTEEIDLRSIGWGNIFQLPFKHMRDYRLRLLLPFFIYSGFEILFVCTGFTLSYGVCSLGLESMGTILMAYGVAAGLGSLLSLGQLRAPRCTCLYAGAALHLVLIVVLYAWAPTPRDLSQRYFVYTVAVLWGVGSGLNKTGLSILLGMLYEDKDRQDFIFTLYHWWQAVAIFITYLWTTYVSYMKVKLSFLLACLLLALACYVYMERKVALGHRPRLPRLPKPKRRNKGYRYFLDEDSDEESDEGRHERGDDDDDDRVDSDYEENDEVARERRDGGGGDGSGDNERPRQRRQARAGSRRREERGLDNGAHDGAAAADDGE
ncbi:unnamed protein product [Lampetra planeri]